MPIIPFISQNTADVETRKMNDNLSNIFGQINKCPFLYGNMVQVSLEQNADSIIAHGLGKAYQGFLVVSPNSFGLVKLSSTENKQKNLTIIVQATNSMVVSLWIF